MLIELTRMSLTGKWRAREYDDAGIKDPEKVATGYGDTPAEAVTAMFADMTIRRWA